MVVVSSNCDKTRYLFSLLLFTIFFPPYFINAGAVDNTYYVAPYGNDSNDGSTLSPFKSIQRALESAKAGDTIILAAGVYREDITTVRNGEPDKPITIKGPKDAIVKGSRDNKIVEINHDYIVLEGFTIDGHYKKDGADAYRGKLIYAMNANNIKILNMTIKNAGDECIRLKYFSSNNEIAYNTISNCGTTDFKYNGGGKNGELIYIGTAPEQLYKNPTNEPDASNNNWIHHNIFEGIGSECVDIKEGSMYNIIEYNSCSGIKDPDSGAISIRGNENIIRYNRIYGNDGGGVRVGGDTLNDGIKNEIYENEIYDNLHGMKIMADPQRLICGNIVDTVGGIYKDNYEVSKACN